MDNDLISRSALLENLNKMLNVGYDDQNPFERGFRRGLALGKRVVELYPAAEDAVPRDEYDSLLKRFRHLLESDYIRSFDEYDPKTGTYKRDIREAIEPMLSADDRARLDNVGKGLELLNTETSPRLIDVLEKSMYELYMAQYLDVAREKIRNINTPKPLKEES